MKLFTKPLMSNELNLRSSRNKRRKFTELELKLKEANSNFIHNNFDECINKAKNILLNHPRCDRAYFLLGLVFEERNDIMKAYNFYMIAAQLMKNNYELWFKLYKISDSLRLLSDKLYFIQILQRFKNSRELVVEKLELFRILKNKYKSLECQIELFEFDGIDFLIFEKIRKETRHRRRTSVIAFTLLKYYRKHPKACGIEFAMNCIRLQYESRYLIGTKNILESQIFPYINIIPNDIRIIYIVSCVLNIKTFTGESLFKHSHDEYKLENNEKVDFYYENISDKVFLSSGSILPELKKSFEGSKTLKLETFEQSEVFSTDNTYKNYANLDLFLSDEKFWSCFREENEIKLLVEVLIELEMYDYAIKLIHKLLKISQTIKEFCFYSLGKISFIKEDYNMASSFFEQVLKINPDNVTVKCKLYNVYHRMGNKDMSNHFKTVSSLINYVDDINTKVKEDFRFTCDKCQKFRTLYFESRQMFNIDHQTHLKITKPLIDDFLINEFIFVTNPKFKVFPTVNDKKIETRNLLKVFSDDENKKIKIQESVRHLSLHGLDSEEWFYVVFEFIVSKIKNRNYLEASVLLRKTFKAFIFQQRKDLIIVFLFLSIRHSIFINDLSLLSFVFKKAITIFGNYNLSHFFFYLNNYFINPQFSHSCHEFIQNIRRYYVRNLINRESDHNLVSDDLYLVGEDSDTTQSGLERSFNMFKVDNLCYLNTLIKGTVQSRFLKSIDRIKKPLTIKEEILTNLLYAMACKSRNNPEKKDTIKRAVSGLNKLLKEAKGETRYVILYNIGKIYEMMKLVGYAERYYKEAYQTTNRELKKLTQLNLILIYKKNGNSVLLEKYYNDKF